MLHRAKSGRLVRVAQEHSESQLCTILDTVISRESDLAVAFVLIRDAKTSVLLDTAYADALATCVGELVLVRIGYTRYTWRALVKGHRDAIKDD